MMNLCFQGFQGFHGFQGFQCVFKVFKGFRESMFQGKERRGEAEGERKGEVKRKRFSWFSRFSSFPWSLKNYPRCPSPDTLQTLKTLKTIPWCPSTDTLKTLKTIPRGRPWDAQGTPRGDAFFSGDAHGSPRGRPGDAHGDAHGDAQGTPRGRPGDAFCFRGRPGDAQGNAHRVILDQSGEKANRS